MRQTVTELSGTGWSAEHPDLPECTEMRAEGDYLVATICDQYTIVIGPESEGENPLINRLIAGRNIDVEWESWGNELIWHLLEN